MMVDVPPEFNRSVILQRGGGREIRYNTDRYAEPRRQRHTPDPGARG